MKKLLVFLLLILASRYVRSQCSVTLTTTGNRCSVTDTLNLFGASNAIKIKWKLSGVTFDSVGITGTVVAGGNGGGSDANQLSEPFGIYVDGSGNIYIDDAQNNRIQKWRLVSQVELQ